MVSRGDSEEFSRDIVTDFARMQQIDLGQEGVMVMLSPYDDKTKRWVGPEAIEEYFHIQYEQIEYNYLEQDSIQSIVATKARNCTLEDFNGLEAERELFENL